ncbi:MAG TPA: hypothetical protein VMF50_15735 [Candidatus Binataceae bacterium]|nr:hypothetical protein [Candidatus Binataceae bacterium]
MPAADKHLLGLDHFDAIGRRRLMAEDSSNRLQVICHASARIGCAIAFMESLDKAPRKKFNAD